MKVPSPLRSHHVRLLKKGSMHQFGDFHDFSNDSGLGFSLDCEPSSSNGVTTVPSKIVLEENSCDALFSVSEGFEKKSNEEPPFKIPRTSYATDDSLDPMLAVAGRQLYEELTKDDKFAPSEQTKSQDLAQLQSLLREVIRKVSQRHDDLQNTFVVSEAVATHNRSKSSQRFEKSNGSQQNSRSLPVAPGKINSGRRITNSKRNLLPMTSTGRNKISQLELRILSQPEEQHRARYLTEGSRGAVKDRKGTGFPTVKLFGYSRPVTLQVFIGTDQGKVQPHLFYQASKVCGKNSTPCAQKKIEGTTVLEIDMTPEKDMTVSCDCVGILKERNVDVEQRLLQFGGTYNKKRSTKCRLVFRASVPLRDGSFESLQVVSAPILCTQPPGIPEICRKSLSECSARGNVELFLIGKNFLKDTKIIFYEVQDDLQGDSWDGINNGWKKIVQPEKEFLQQTHLICVVPPYHDETILAAVRVRLVVESSGKRSEAHNFTYTPVLEQPKNVVFQNNALRIATSANHSCAAILPPIVTSPESSLSSPLVVSTAIPVLHQDSSRLDFSQGGSSTIISVSNGDLQQSISVPGSDSTATITWTREKDIWGKADSNSKESQAFAKPSSSDEKHQDHNLRDLLTQHSEKLLPMHGTDLSIVPVDGGGQPLSVLSTCSSQLPDLDFSRNEMIETVCSSNADILTSASENPLLMSVGSYQSSIIQNQSPSLTSVANPAVSKAEVTGTQGSIEHINMMTMLRDSELLQLINPSTFDNV